MSDLYDPNTTVQGSFVLDLSTDEQRQWAESVSAFLDDLDRTTPDNEMWEFYGLAYDDVVSLRDEARVAANASPFDAAATQRANRLMWAAELYHVWSTLEDSWVSYDARIATTGTRTELQVRRGDHTAAGLVLDYLRRFNPDGAFAYTWAIIELTYGGVSQFPCSGGAAFVTATGIGITSSFDAINLAEQNLTVKQ